MPGKKKLLTEQEALQVLSSYLQDITYKPEQAKLDKGVLPPECQKMVAELERLLRDILEAREFGRQLGSGVIRSAKAPVRSNYLAAPLKSLHGLLLHLLWLMDELGRGNLAQRLDLANDLSFSFNKMVDNLVDLSLKDKLTGALNANGFESRCREVLDRCPGDYYLISININDFRHFDALYGSEKGDVLLRQVAEFCHSRCGVNELYARFHADNFVCLVLAESAEAVAERFDMDALSRQNNFSYRTFMFRQGIYKVTRRTLPVRKMCAYALFAERALKKDASRAYVIFDKELEARFEEENSILSNFYRGISQKEFVLYYQPKVNLSSGLVQGAEALVRWRTKNQEVVLPGMFVNLFEQNGLIAELDFYVLEQVCAYLHLRLAAGKPVVPIAVNFSRVHLLDADFINRVVKLLRKYEVTPDLIEPEITETAFFESTDAMITMIEGMHQAGFRIAMDDFGSGFSSLNMLKNIPVDVLKIDKLFFEDFEVDERGWNLVQDILSIARHLGLRCVAEGVENKQQAEFLQKRGCELAQGFYFYHPLKEEKFDQLLQTQG
jgi:EAL domain-containing protein (putative c-di-GMP-specific phosphodiesterase class I)/GGDEF domain-containing protein